MAGNIFSNVKTSKPFKRFDILVYAIVSLLVIGLFCGFVFFSGNEPASGFEVLVEDKVALSYHYDTDTLTISENFQDSVEVNEDLIKIYFNKEKTEYNVVKIDKKLKHANVIETSCKKQECLHFPPLKNNGGIIICLPHSFVLQSTVQSGGVVIG